MPPASFFIRAALIRSVRPSRLSHSVPGFWVHFSLKTCHPRPCRVDPRSQQPPNSVSFAGRYVDGRPIRPRCRFVLPALTGSGDTFCQSGEIYSLSHSSSASLSFRAFTKERAAALDCGEPSGNLPGLTLESVALRRPSARLFAIG
jgi:hypothetical protein